MKPLTKSQLKVYLYLKNEIRHKGYPPSVREICAATELSSTATIHKHLHTLEDKGYIRRDPAKPRAIEILEPDFYGGRREMADIPILGKVAAGQPIFADESVEDTFSIPLDYVDTSGELFMLRVKGDSMIEAGIFNKDLIIVKQQSVAANGDMVVALVEDSATVKTYYREKNRIRLQPENSDMEPIYVRDVTILGKVVGLYRKI